MTLKWKDSPKSRPQLGDQRIVEKFLFFPKWIDGETRWLGSAKILQEWSRAVRSDPVGCSYPIQYWRDVHWND